MEAYKHARVLIVDDDREVCDIVQEMISYWGIKTKIVTATAIRWDSFNLLLRVF